MDILIGVLYGVMSLLNPEIKAFYLVKYGFLMLTCYVILILYVPHILKKCNIFEKKSIILLICILIAMGIPTGIFKLYNPDYEITQYVRLSFFVPIIIYILWKKRDFSSYLINFSFLINIIGVFQFFFMGQAGRVTGIFSHPNFYSIYLIIVIIYILERLKFNSFYQKYNYFYYIYILFILALILFGTGARTSFITIIVVLLFNFCLNLRKKPQSLFILITIATLGFLLLIRFKSTLFQTRIFNLEYGNTYTNQVNSFEWRLLRWSDGLIEFTNQSVLGKIFGTGWQSSPLLSPTFKGFSMHNEYLRMLVDFGVVGLIIFLVMLVAFFSIGLKRIDLRGHYSLCLIMIVIIIAGITENIFVSSESFSILVLSIANSFSTIQFKIKDSKMILREMDSATNKKIYEGV